MPVRRALLSVSDKTGIVELAQALDALNIELLSTGGTAKLLRDAGLMVKEVAEHTGFPEMLDGRVKTLHPTIHGGLLARREDATHMGALETHGIAPIDLLVVNLYPFEQTVARDGCTLEDAIENIDIGGPAMVRSAAKNWRSVAVLTEAGQYRAVIDQLQSQAGLDDAIRLSLATTAFGRIADYDVAIGEYLSGLQLDATGLPDGGHQDFSNRRFGRYEKLFDLRYGENPHQQAAYYRELNPAPGSIVTARPVQGKALSYNNIADADAAWECVKSFDTSACVIVKHANPCGVALGDTPLAAYQAAFACDPTSAFGGIIAFNRPLDEAAAKAISAQFVEVLMAPGFSDAALAVFAAKPNVRLLEISLNDIQASGHTAAARGLNAIDIKRIGSGLLVQDADNHQLTPDDLKVVTEKAPTDQQMQDLMFAWRVAKFVKSNAIVFCANSATVGVGAGQMSRLDSARIAAIKADAAGLSLTGSVVASDAFFPFRDGLDVVVDAGAIAVIQPGGSMRDDEVIAAANERGIAMVTTGVRHFRH
ncbi:MAG: bifunctional phosphoribosylaminoimidazolecarboxamide formyltransferase/IMP cyclohydrolase [Burkholderiaceae bacterium]